MRLKKLLSPTAITKGAPAGNRPFAPRPARFFVARPRRLLRLPRVHTTSGLARSRKDAPSACAAISGRGVLISLHQEDVSMRSYDLSPLYRSTIGFDRLFSLLDQHSGLDSAAPTYPPYNIERTGENAYRITIAVAGFADSELSIETRENTLTVRGSKETPEGRGREARSSLSGHRRARFRATFPARRSCLRHRRDDPERAASCRSRPRGSRSPEAPHAGDQQGRQAGRIRSFSRSPNRRPERGRNPGIIRKGRPSGRPFSSIRAARPARH